MNKKFLLAWTVVFIGWMLGSMVVHSMLLAADYSSMQQLFRQPADAQNYFPFMLLAHVILAGAFVWIYARGVEAKPWTTQGVRFGIAIALLTVVPTYLIYYAVQPMPGAMVAKQIVFESVKMVVLGLLVAFVYRHRATPAV